MIPADRRVLRLAERPTLDTLALSSEAMPMPGPGEALVRAHATSLNFHDFLVADGHIPQPAGRVPMSDGAGVVVALGERSDSLSVGDRVMGSFFPDWLDGPPTAENCARISGETTDGFAADHVVVPIRSLCAMPSGWSFEEAACLPCAGLTAWRAVTIEAGLQDGDSVVLPGSGGLALFCLQIAVTLGIRAIVTSSSDEKLARLRDLGAHEAINYRTNPDWSTAVRDATNGRGADAVIEIGGASSFEQSVRSVRDHGRVVVVGSTGNAPPDLPLRDIVMRHLRVQGMAVGNLAQLREFVDFCQHHDLRPVIDKNYRLEELGNAFRHQLSGRHFGKIVVTI